MGRRPPRSPYWERSAICRHCIVGMNDGASECNFATRSSDGVEHAGALQSLNEQQVKCNADESMRGLREIGGVIPESIPWILKTRTGNSSAPSSPLHSPIQRCYLTCDATMRHRGILGLAVNSGYSKWP